MRLHDFAEVSDGNFRVITYSYELKNYLNERGKYKAITTGFLGVEGMQVLEGEIDNVDTIFKPVFV